MKRTLNKKISGDKLLELKLESESNYSNCHRALDAFSNGEKSKGGNMFSD